MRVVQNYFENLLFLIHLRRSFCYLTLIIILYEMAKLEDRPEFLKRAGEGGGSHTAVVYTHQAVSSTDGYTGVFKTCYTKNRFDKREAARRDEVGM